jgi:hypothetical protein
MRMLLASTGHGHDADSWTVDGMRSLLGLIVAFLLGVAVAGGAAYGVVELAKQTPDNTSPVQQPLVDYGSR